MAETQPAGGIKEKEDVNVTALAAGVSDISHSSIQGAEKTATKFVDLSEFYEEPEAQVLPQILEDVSTHTLGKAKTPKKPRQKKKKKNNSKATEQALKMQPAHIKNPSSSAGDKIKVLSSIIHEPSTSKVNRSDSPDNLKPSDLPAGQQSVPEAISNQDAMKPAPPAIAEVLTDIIGKRKKPRKARAKKNKNYSNTTAQALKMQPANTYEASSSTNDKTQVNFIVEPCSSETNPPKNIKPQPDASVAISDQDPKTQVLPAMTEEMSTNILGKQQKTKKPLCKKNINHSNIAEQAPQMQPANIDKLSSSDVAQTLVHFIRETSKIIMYPRKMLRTATRLSYGYSMAEVLPAITEETSKDINRKPKKQRKRQQKKKKNNSNINGASSSAEEIQLNQIQEPSTCNVENKKSETGQQRNKVLLAVESKQDRKDKDMVNINIPKSKTEKVFLPLENVEIEEDEKPQTSKNAMKKTYEKAEGDAQIPVQVHDLATEAVGNDDVKPQTSNSISKESDKKAEGNAEAPVKRHLLFFREYYDHNGRLCARNLDEGKLYADALYSQVNLACVDYAIRKKIEEAIRAILKDITTDYTDFRLSRDHLQILFNRMHNIIFMRLFRMGLSELASIEISNIVRYYRTHFKRADDIDFMFSLISNEDL